MVFNEQSKLCLPCLAYCEVHGFLKGKIRVNKTADGEVFAVKTTRLVDEETARDVEKKWERLQNSKNKDEDSVVPETPDNMDIQD